MAMFLNNEDAYRYFWQHQTARVLSFSELGNVETEFEQVIATKADAGYLGYLAQSERGHRDYDD